MTNFTKINEYTLKATDSMDDGNNSWGNPSLSRIFNFKSRQVTTVYERGGTQDYRLPRESYGSETGMSVAVTSSMQVQNFSDIENPDEIAEMHAQLLRLRGAPPPLEEVLPSLGKKPAGLRQPTP